MKAIYKRTVKGVTYYLPPPSSELNFRIQLISFFSPIYLNFDNGQYHWRKRLSENSLKWMVSHGLVFYNKAGVIAFNLSEL